MSKGVNKVFLIGTVGSDPVSHTFPDGGAITNFSLATSESWKDKQTGQKVEKTEWHRVVAKDMGARKWGQWAGDWLKKGSKVYVEGKLATRKWADKAGVEHNTTEIVLQEMQTLGDPKAASAPAPAPQQAPPRAQTEGQRRGPDPTQAPPDYGQDSFGMDDIPF